MSQKDFDAGWKAGYDRGYKEGEDAVNLQYLKMADESEQARREIQLALESSKAAQARLHEQLVAKTEELEQHYLDDKEEYPED